MRWIKGLKARGQDDRAHLQRQGLRFLIEVDRVGGAEFFAGTAFTFFKINAGILINGIFKRNRLGIIDISGLALDQPGIVGINDLFRAFFGALTAGDALLFVDITGFFKNFYFEVAGFTGDVLNFTKRVDLDIQMPADLDQFRRDNSHGTVVGGEGLVQLRHGAPDGGGLLEKVHIIARVRQIESGLHSGNAATDDHN